MNWIKLAQGRVCWQAVVAINIRVYKGKGISGLAERPLACYDSFYKTCVFCV